LKIVVLLVRFWFLLFGVGMLLVCEGVVEVFVCCVYEFVLDWGGVGVVEGVWVY